MLSAREIVNCHDQQLRCSTWNRAQHFSCRQFPSWQFPFKHFNSSHLVSPTTNDGIMPSKYGREPGAFLSSLQKVLKFAQLLWWQIRSLSRARQSPLCSYTRRSCGSAAAAQGENGPTSPWFCNNCPRTQTDTEGIREILNTPFIAQADVIGNTVDQKLVWYGRFDW